jgi:peptidoglycan/xylan/chitin deacetylase (PgdA/CDA1 family)
MSPEDLKILARLGHQVWSHGMTHTSFSSLSKERALKELEGSREKIREWTGKPPAGFSYPYGHITHGDGSPAEWVRDMGYSYGFTLRRGKVTPESNPFLLPREHAEGNWTIDELKYFLLS